MSDINRYLLIDVGGTWIKGISIDAAEYGRLRRDGPRDKFLALFNWIMRVPSESSDSTGTGFCAALKTLAGKCGPIAPYGSVVISTAGLVSPCGSRLVKSSAHLEFLRNASWRDELQNLLGCPVTLINDGEAFMLGAAELGYVPRLGTVCAATIGTGLGCAIVKDGRWWRPQRITPLLGSIRLPGGTYDHWVSASRLAAREPGHDLIRFLREPEFAEVCEIYWSGLAEVVATAGFTYGTDNLLLGGGLCDAASAAGVDIKAAINRHFAELPPELNHWPELEIVKEGNLTQLIGVAALAAGLAGNTDRTTGEVITIDTPDVSIGQVAGHIAQHWLRGGRIIFAGAGYGGRLAAAATIEICHGSGVSRDRVVTVLAGGIGEAALNMEPGEEADAFAVSDMILLRPGPDDTIVGISTGGNVFFVQSALAYARLQGSATVMIQTGDANPADAGAFLLKIIHLLTAAVREK